MNVKQGRVVAGLNFVFVFGIGILQMIMQWVVLLFRLVFVLEDKYIGCKGDAVSGIVF